MNSKNDQVSHGRSRREFLKTGAVVGVPLAAIAAPAVALADDGSRTKLARLEAEREIETLQRRWLRDAEAGRLRLLNAKVSSVHATHGSDPIAVELSDDGELASVGQDCIVEIVEDPADDCTMVQMARLQGNRMGARKEQRQLRTTYANCSQKGWRLTRVELI